MDSIIQFLNILKKIKLILFDIRKLGGIPYLVGGAVRDLILDRSVKDIDIEVHGISLENLEQGLLKHGKVSLVGKQFGVLRLHNFDIDWSVPRKDSKGRKPNIQIIPEMTIELACRRRDLTMNAMAINLGFVCDNFDDIYKKTKEKSIFDINTGMRLIDIYGGFEDLKSGILKVVDEDLFKEDPLRFYRVMQFVGRFEMYPDEKLNSICQNMDLRQVSEGGELTRERIYEEIKKLLLRSRQPSLGFRWLKEIGRLKEIFPELGVLNGISQRVDYHPEEDVFEHTMQCLDAVTIQCGDSFVQDELQDDNNKFMIMLSILSHDLGKAVTTDEHGHSKGHDVAGVPLAKSFLKRFTRNTVLIRSVCKLVRYHRMPIVLVEEGAKEKAYKRLAVKLAPEVSIMQLAVVAWCDIRGRNAKGMKPLKYGFKNGDEIIKKFLSKAKDAKVERKPEKSILLGRHLLDDITPGPELGKLLKKAYKIQIEEGIKDLAKLRKRVLKTK